jgi:hypothetical protein
LDIKAYKENIVSKVMERLALRPIKEWADVYPERTIICVIPGKVADNEEERLRRILPESDLLTGPMAPHRFVLWSLLGGGNDFQLIYRVVNDGDFEVTLLFDTEEGALQFKRAFQLEGFQQAVCLSA